MGGNDAGRSALAFLFSADEVEAAVLEDGVSSLVRAFGSDDGDKPSSPSTPSSRRYDAVSATCSASDFRNSLACDSSFIGYVTHYTERNVERGTPQR